MLGQSILITFDSVFARLSMMGESLPPYNPNVLLGTVAIGKLVATTVISCASDKKQAADTATASGSHAKMLDKNPLLFYALPSLLYNIANVVMFVTVGTISPGEIMLLWNLKIVSTAVLMRIFLKRKLNKFKWIAIVTLMLGVLLIEWGDYESESFVDATAHPGVNSTESLNATQSYNSTMSATTSPSTFQLSRS